MAEEYKRETKKPKIPPFLGTRVDQIERDWSVERPSCPLLVIQGI